MGLIFRISYCIAFLFGAGLLVADDKSDAGDGSAQQLRELVNGLDQGNLQEAFRLLQSEYIKKEDIDHLNVNRAAIQGLLERLDFGAMLLTNESLSSRNSPYDFYSSRVNEQIGYVRFGKFTREELDQLDKVLGEYLDEEDNQVSTLLLDLRSPQVQADFNIAAQILSRFRPPNELLFKIRQPGDERPVLFLSKANEISWSKEVVILIDSETGNVGEIIARVLQEKNNSLTVGEKTRGLTVEYRDVKIGDDRILRYAIAEVILEDESSIFQVGVKPELLSKPALEEKHKVFKQTNDGKSIKPYVFAVERPRFNERALVQKTDPELEVELAKKNGKQTVWNVVLPEDRILQKAVDVLRTQHFLESAKRRRKLR